MISLKNTVVKPLIFEKVATLKLPKDIMEWNEKILQQFYEEHSSIEKGSNTSVVVNNIDDKLGYAKGSVVVWVGDNKINFPVIISEWKLEPFDVFVTKDNEYVYATDTEISKALTSEDLGKTVGGKVSTSEDIVSPGDISNKEAIKVSSDWKAMASEHDLEKLAVKLSEDKRLATKNVIDVANKIEIEGKKKADKLSISDVVKPKTSNTITSLDAEDMSLLRVVPKNSKCIVKVDVSEFSNISRNLSYVANGYSVPGYVIDDSTCDGSIFISTDGKSVAYAKEFYGTAITPCNNIRELISSVTSNEMDLKGCNKLILIGSDDAAITKGNYSKRVVNGKSVYISDKKAVVVSDVKTPVLVERIDDPAMLVAIGDKPSLLIPGTTIVVNTANMEDLTYKLITPGYDMIDRMKKANINSVSVSVGKNGINIDGNSADKLKKVAGINNGYSVSESMSILQSVGMTKEASRSVIGNVINNSLAPVVVYGVNDDYINTSKSDSMSKTANAERLLGDYAESIKVDLLKEASVIDDPTVVDRVLSLNFINKDNIVRYIKFKDELEESSGVLAELIVASRLGLKDVDEGAVKKALEGINSVVDGLNKLKLIIDN